jgi:hypothetical protein
MTLSCFLAWALALLFLPVIALFWISETKQQRMARRIARLRAQGNTWSTIAFKLNCSA